MTINELVLLWPTIQARLLAWFASTAFKILLGMLVGAFIVWKIQDWRMDRIKRSHTELVSKLKQATEEEKTKVQALQGQINTGFIQYKAAQKLAKEESDVLKKKLDEVASSTNVCLSPAVIGVFDSTRRPSSSQGQGTRKLASTPARTSRAGAGYLRPTGEATPAPELLDPPFNAVSERGMALWKKDILRQYNEARKLHFNLSTVILNSDAFEVDHSR